MQLVNDVLFAEYPSFHQVERQLRQENQLVSLEQSTTNPRENGHTKSVAEIENPPLNVVGWLGLRNGLHKEGDERVEGVLVHVVDQAPVLFSFSQIAAELRGYSADVSEGKNLPRLS